MEAIILKTYRKHIPPLSKSYGAISADVIIRQVIIFPKKGNEKIAVKRLTRFGD